MTPRNRTRRAVLTLALAGTAGVGFAWPATSAARPSSHAPVPVIEWSDCGEGFECATAAVPLDHRRPRRATIDLSLIRHPALDQEHRIGTMFLAHPAGTIGGVRNAPPGVFALLSRFDVVGYDGRGTGATGIECGIDAALLEPFTSNATRPDTIDEGAMVAAADEYVRRCVDAHGELLPHLSTAAMARDLDLLRAAVGDEQLTYVGMSQGTDLGATYASMFPGRVRAMVFDAPIDAAGWRDRPLEIAREQDVSYEQELDRFFTVCAAHSAACGFGGADPESAFDALLAALDADPIDSSDPAYPGPVDGDDVRTAAADAMVDPVRWAELAAALSAAAAGDGALIQQIVADAVDNPLALEGFTANVAVSTRFPRRLEDNLADLHHRFGLLDHFWARNTFIALAAHRWTVRSRDTFDGDFENPAESPTILIIGGTHDPATPFQWAQRLTDDLGNARLFTYHSDGHGAIGDGNPCVLIPAATYLADPTVLPPVGASCEQVVEPFGS